MTALEETLRTPVTGPVAAAGRRRWAGLTARLRPRWLTDDVMRGTRWGLIGVWLISFGHECWAYGLPFDREGLLVWIATAAAVISIGKRSIATVIVDFLPFALVLVAYDYLRGLADTLGMPTWWHPQVDVDTFLFGGHDPTVWLQAHLKHPDVRWYDIGVCLCYYSFFFLPYVTAGVMWWRSRTDFYRWSLRFVGLSFLGFSLFALIPAAPPWAAARCSAAEIASHPNNPLCMYFGGRAVPSGGLLGPFPMHQPGANPWVERIAARGFGELHLGIAQSLWTKGFAIADPVAAVPSLHLGGTVLFVLFMWSRVSRWWKPVLVAYPLFMTFTLTYSGEHFVADCIAGALAAAVVHAIANGIERRRMPRHRPDTLEAAETAPETVDEPAQETPCPPPRPLPAEAPTTTMPSST